MTTARRIDTTGAVGVEEVVDIHCNSPIPNVVTRTDFPPPLRLHTKQSVAQRAIVCVTQIKVPRFFPRKRVAMSQVPRMLLLIELFAEHGTLVPLPLLSKISTRRPSYPAIAHEGKRKCEQRTHVTRTFQVQTAESVRSRLRHNGVDQSVSSVLVSQFELCGTQITDAQPPTVFVGRAQFRISGAQCRGRGLRGIGCQVAEIGQLERIAIGEFHTILRSSEIERIKNDPNLASSDAMKELQKSYKDSPI